MKKINQKVLYTTIGVISLLLLWQIVAMVISTSIILPTPIETATEFIKLFGENKLYLALLSTGLRTIIGFLFAFIVAGTLGTLAYLFPKFKYAFSPIVTVLRAVPTMSIILLAVIWFNPSVSPVFIGFLIIFPLLYERFSSALSSVDPKLIMMSKVYNVSLSDRITKLYIPSIRKDILSSAKSTISLNVKVVIAGEVLAYTAKSIGWQMYSAKLNIFTASLFAWTIWALVLSFLFEGLIVLLDKLTDPVRIRDRKKVNNE